MRKRIAPSNKSIVSRSKWAFLHVVVVQTTKLREIHRENGILRVNEEIRYFVSNFLFVLRFYASETIFVGPGKENFRAFAERREVAHHEQPPSNRNLALFAIRSILASRYTDTFLLKNDEGLLPSNCVLEFPKSSY